MLEKDKTSPIQGTSLTIAGFREPKNWRRRIAASVIESFFYAVDRGKLTVIVEPDIALDAHDLLEINKGSLEEWFNFLEKSIGNEDYGGVDIDRSLRQARAFWDISQRRTAGRKARPGFGALSLVDSSRGWIAEQSRLCATNRYVGYHPATWPYSLLWISGFRCFMCV